MPRRYRYEMECMDLDDNWVDEPNAICYTRKEADEFIEKYKWSYQVYESKWPLSKDDLKKLKSFKPNHYVTIISTDWR